MIHVSEPDIKLRDVWAVTKSMLQGYVSSVGPQAKELPQKFAEWNGMQYGVACNSGTNALYLALKAFGVGRGDEVIVPEFTMIATAFAVSYTGATPVFVDCNEKGLINPDLIQAKITPKTKAIIPVHIYGRRCDMERIIKIANDNRLKVIEDSAEGIGIKPTGDAACFSLFANKTITAGEGGLIVTNDENIARDAYYYANMAFEPTHTFLHQHIAHNHRMTNMQGALTLSQLKRVDKILKKRSQIEDWYNEYLGLTEKRDVLWMFDIYVDERDRLMEWLEWRDIETRYVFKPMSQQPPYLGDYTNLKAYELSLRGLYLPTYTHMTRSQVKYIANAVKKFTTL